MSWLARFGAFWYDFVIGDDWRLAAGVVVTVAAVDLLVHKGVDWWWLLPIVAATLLTVSVWREVRAQRR